MHISVRTISIVLLLLAGCNIAIEQQSRRDTLQDDTLFGNPDLIPLGQPNQPLTRPVLRRVDNHVSEPQTPFSDQKEYKIKPGDIIEVSVWEENMTRDLLVRPDGKISYLLIGEIKAVGKSFRELRKELETELSEYILEPRVTIIGKSFAGNFLSVLGAVANPGRHIISQRDRVLDAITKAGGLRFSDNTIQAGDIANLRKAYLSRNGKILKIDFEALIENGDMSQNIPIQIGDFIYIPSSLSEPVYVLGEVKVPRVMPSRGRMTILDALASAGGFKTSAYKRSICIVRGSMTKPTVYKTSFPSIVKGTEKNFRLEPGDIVFVPATIITHLERVSSQVVPFLDAILKTDQTIETGRDSLWIPHAR